MYEFRKLGVGKKVCFLRVGNRRPCAFTSARARRGARKFDGECALTRSAYGDGDDSDGAILYTTCSNCREAICVACLEAVADECDKYASRVVPHDVWHALSARAWRQGAARCRGFEPRRAGGGKWVSACPLCIDVVFKEEEVPVPRTLMNKDYLQLAPQLVRHEPSFSFGVGTAS